MRPGPEYPASGPALVAVMPSPEASTKTRNRAQRLEPSPEEGRESAEDESFNAGSEPTDGPSRGLWRSSVGRARRRRKSSLNEMFQKQLAYAGSSERAAGSVEERTLVGTRTTKNLTSYLRKTIKASDDAGTVSQGTGGAGSTGNARMLDDTNPKFKVLLYRLVALPDPNNPWGDGLLVQVHSSALDATAFRPGHGRHLARPLPLSHSPARRAWAPPSRSPCISPCAPARAPSAHARAPPYEITPLRILPTPPPLPASRPPESTTTTMRFSSRSARCSTNAGARTRS